MTQIVHLNFFISKLNTIVKISQFKDTCNPSISKNKPIIIKGAIIHVTMDIFLHRRAQRIRNRNIIANFLDTFVLDHLYVCNKAGQRMISTGLSC